MRGVWLNQRDLEDTYPVGEEEARMVSGSPVSNFVDQWLSTAMKGSDLETRMSL
jgi:hypothetical protein